MRAARLSSASPASPARVARRAPAHAQTFKTAPPAVVNDHPSAAHCAASSTDSRRAPDAGARPNRPKARSRNRRRGERPFRRGHRASGTQYFALRGTGPFAGRPRASCARFSRSTRQRSRWWRGTTPASSVRGPPRQAGGDRTRESGTRATMDSQEAFGVEPADFAARSGVALRRLVPATVNGRIDGSAGRRASLRSSPTRRRHAAPRLAVEGPRGGRRWSPSRPYYVAAAVPGACIANGVARPSRRPPRSRQPDRASQTYAFEGDLRELDGLHG